LLVGMGRGLARQTASSTGRVCFLGACASLTKYWVPQAEIKAAETEIALKDEVREDYGKHDGHNGAVLRSLLRGLNRTCVTAERCDFRLLLVNNECLIGEQCGTCSLPQVINLLTRKLGRLGHDDSTESEGYACCS
jgi:hypothetical protein